MKLLFRSLHFTRFCNLQLPVCRFFSTTNTIFKNMSGEKKFERLSTDVIPRNYKISLKPDLENYTFIGYEIVDVELKKAVDSITLNSIDIDVKSAKCQGKSANVEYNKDEEKVILKFSELLKAGNAQIEIDFNGILNEKMKGFYRSKYTTDSGEEKRMAVTQFEATDARRAFPCWDEPSLKATFEISLSVDKKYIALSNMPEVKRSDESDGTVRVDFAPSPIMSTYLLAFIVGEMDFIESKDEDGVQVRVFTTLGKSERGRFALDVACKTLPFYRAYFDIAYPLPKMDLVAIPDFAAGAMENWGLVTYRETALLVDPKESSSMGKQTVALVVGHELAHQWFGNLVTMEWWTHLWLNEGFASWIEYLCVDYCYPDFDIWTQFTSSDFATALQLDALQSSHPIEVPVTSPDEIDEIFDVISYCKGASVIRMLHAYLGDEAFRNGLRIYLKRHKYSNTVTEQLWSALEEASGLPVGKIMDTWTKQTGYPVISVNIVENGSAVKVDQERFIADGSKIENDSSIWHVPITLSRADQPEDSTTAKFLLTKSSDTFPLPENLRGHPLFANMGAIGVYRTRYNSVMLEGILNALKGKKFSPIDRFKLQSDMFALARAGLVSTVDVLKIVAGYKSEDNFTVWSNLSSNLGQIRLFVEQAGEMPHYEKFITALAIPSFQNLGWTEKATDTHNEKLLRPLIIGMLGRAGYTEVVDEARKLFEAHFNQIGGDACSLPADLRTAVYSIVLKHGGEPELEKIIQLLDRTDLHEERMRLLRTAGSVGSNCTEKVLTLAMSDKVRNQDKISVIAGCTGSLEARQLVWKFFKDNWPELKEKYAGMFLLSSLIKSVCHGFVLKNHEEEITKFFEANPAPCERAVKQCIENVKGNADQFERDAKHLVEYFKSQ